MSSFRSYVSPWSKSTYGTSPSTTSSSSSYLRGSGGGSTSLLSSASSSNKDDKPYGSTGTSYSRSRYGSSASEKSSGDGGGDGGSSSNLRDGSSTTSSTSGYRSSTLTSSSPSSSTRTPSATRTSYRSPYSSSTLGSSSSTTNTGLGGSSIRDRSSSRDRLGYLSSLSSSKGRNTSPEPEDHSSRSTTSSHTSSYSSRPSLRDRTLPLSRPSSLRSRYKEDADRSPTSPSTAPPVSLRSPRADVTPFKWTRSYSSSGGLRSPGSELSPTVFGVSTPENKEDGSKSTEEDKTKEDKTEEKEKEKEGVKEKIDPEIISVITRATSPNPPSTVVRIRRYELAWQIQKDVPRPPKREMVDAEVQTDKLEEESPSSRYTRISATSSRLSTSPWYKDRYSGGSSSYVPRTYSRYSSSASTPSPTVSGRPSPVRSSSGSNVTEQENEQNSPSTKSNSIDSLSSSSKTIDQNVCNDSQPENSENTPLISEESKSQSSKTESKSSENAKIPSWKQTSKSSDESVKTATKKASKSIEDLKRSSSKVNINSTEETKPLSSKTSSKSAEDSKASSSLSTSTKSSEEYKTPSSKSDWKASNDSKIAPKPSSSAESSKSLDDSKLSTSKVENKSSEDPNISPSKKLPKSSEESKSTPSSKSSEEPKIISWKSSSKSTDESKILNSKTGSSEEINAASKNESKTSTEPKTPLWKTSKSKSVDETKTESKKSEVNKPLLSKSLSKTSLVTSDCAKSVDESKSCNSKSKSTASECLNKTESKVSLTSEGKPNNKDEVTEKSTGESKDNLGSEESIYPLTTEKDKENATFTSKPQPSSACSSTSSSPCRGGRERSPSAGRASSRPPSVPVSSASSSRAGSSERADTTSSSSRTSAGVKSLSSYSSSQESPAAQKRLTSPRPPPAPRPLQRSSSAATLQSNVANKDFRKSALNMGEDGKVLEDSDSPKRIVKKKTTRSKTLSGSETALPDTLSAPIILSPNTNKPVVASKEIKKTESSGISSDEDEDDDSTSAESVEEDVEEKSQGNPIRTTAKPPIPSPIGIQSVASRVAKSARIRRRAEGGGSWREAYKAEEDVAVGEPIVEDKKINNQEGIVSKVDSSKNLVSDKVSEDANKSSSNESEGKKKKTYRIRREPSGELPWWAEGSTEPVPEGIIVKTPSNHSLASINKSTEDANTSVGNDSDGKKKKVYRIKREPSGELPWWAEGSTEPVPEGIIVKTPSTHSLASVNKSNEDASKSGATESEGNKKKIIKIRRDPSGELPWWAEGSTEPVPEGIIVKTPSTHSLASVNKSSEDASKSIGNDSDGKKKKVYRIRREPSGELPWWADGSTEPVPEGIIVKTPSTHSLASANKSSEDASKSVGNDSDGKKKKVYRIRKEPSGELPWWAEGSSEPVPEGIIVKTPSTHSLASANKSSEDASKSIETESDGKKRPLKMIKQPSGEKTWYVECTNEEMPDGIVFIETGGSPTRKSSTEDVNNKSSNKKLIKLTRDPSGEKAWWMEGSNEPIPEGIIRMASSHSLLSKPSDSSEGSSKSSSKKGKLIPIWRQASGERAWWLEGSDATVPDGIQRIESSNSLAGSQGEKGKLSRASSQEEGSGKSSGKDGSTTGGSGGLRRRRLWRVESGERAWWMEGSDAPVPEGIERIESAHSLASVGAEVAKKVAEAKKEKGVKSSSSSESSSSESTSSSSEEEEEEDEEGSTDSEEEGGEAEGVGRGRVRTMKGGIPNGALGARTSPDGVEAVGGERAAASAGAIESGVSVPSKEGEEEEENEEEEKRRQKERARRNLRFFIGRHTNIDDLLGSEVATPADSVAAMVAAVEASQRSDGRGVKIKSCAGMGSEDESSSPLEEVDPSQVRIHDSTAQTPTLLQQQTVADTAGSGSTSGRPPPTPPPLPPDLKLDDAALQVYRDGDYGAYLDLEASISEQPEEFEGFQSNRKNSIVLRTQLSVRVHAVIEKLLNSEGRELRRALFSLKQIFQEDKDLVHEFVQNEGLACLIKVGSEADQNYQNYILRALGQVMLYVDGMNGVMAHNQTVQWLYSLIASRFRLVVKTALKLLLVFAEYVESNCLLLIRAVLTVDSAQGLPPWSNIMRLLKDYDTADTELLIYATTLINRTLNGIPDQDTYYDQVDALEEQGMEGVVQRYMSKQGTDLDLLRQFQIYEAVLHHEDGEEKGAPLKQLDETIRKTLRNRKSLADSDSSERRKSRRHSTGTSPQSQALSRQRHCNGHANLRLKPTYPGHQELGGEGMGEGEEESSSGSSHSPSPTANGTPTSPLANHLQFNSSGTNKGVSENVGVTPALRRRRERAERQRSFIREQQESGATLRATLGQTDDGKSERNENGNAAISTNGHHDTSTPWSQRTHKDSNSNKEGSGTEDGEGGERAAVRRLRRENTVRDLTQKLASQGGILTSPTEERVPRDIGDMSGIVSKAKEGLARSKSKADLRSPTDSSSSGRGGASEIKKSETELHWEELLSSSKRPLNLCDLDFTDLVEEDDVDILSPVLPMQGGILPPPPPPCSPTPTPPPAPRVPPAPPPVGGGFGRPPPPPPLGYSRTLLGSPAPAAPSPATLKKNKKTVKLFWKEVREDPVALSKLSGGTRNPSNATMIWDELQPVSIDTQKLEHLFESRAKDIIGKKQQELNKSKEIIVLDPKRSNAINIGMTKLPPPRSIKTAILKMDSTIVNREGIEKLLTMLPTEEERSRIQEAQSANPDVPLGSAEQFLLTLASISELSARLKLWAFKLDYENSEKEVAEPLMDLKQGMETLRASKTFRSILSTLLSVGIFLNGNEVKGFQIEYLAKVPEVKDTVHKHSLLHHLCHIVMEKFPDSSDLYSEIGAVTRASKVDFDELATSIQRMEQECKASWDHLKVIAKHDGSTMVKVKMSDFLADCAERIIVLGIVHRRVMNRFYKFLLWLGIPMHRVQDTKPSEFCKVISEFSLEYRTTRERVLQQLEKKASHRERNKTRGKMITDVGKFRTKEDRADAELRQLLGSDFSEADSFHGTLPWRRQRKDIGNTRARGLTALLRGGDGNECQGDNMTDGDDEILESLVKTATKGPSTRTTPRERKRTRHADRKSLRRTLKNGLSEEEKQHLAAYIKGY